MSMRPRGARRSAIAMTTALLALSLVGVAGAQEQVAVPGSAARGVSEVARNMLVDPPWARPLISPEIEGRRAYRLHVWSVSLAEAKVALLDMGMTKSFAPHFARAGASVLVNGGFFDSRGAPVGLSMSQGRVYSEYSRRLSGGVLTIEAGRAHLYETERFVMPEGVDFAIQAKPRLVVRGASNIRSNDGARADRTALCIREGGTRLDLVIARSNHDDGRHGPSLFRFGRILAARGCEEALNLDGGPSTGAVWRQAGRTRVLPPRSPVRQAVVVSAL